MSLRFMDGFDQFYGETQMIDTMTAAGYTVGGYIGVSDGRTPASKAVQIGNGGTSGSIKRTFASDQNITVLGFAYMASEDRDNIVSIASVATLAWSATTGQISIGGVPGVASIVRAVWYYFEIVIDKTAGEIRVYINNELDLTVALPSGAAFITDFECTWASPGDIKKMDDLTFVDSSAGRYTNRIGPVAITARMPVVDVDEEWSAASGTDHFAMVNNVPVDPAKFIQSNTSGAFDTFLASGPVSDPNNILAVGVVARARKSDVDNRQLGLVVGPKAGTNKEVLQPTLQTTDTYSYAVFEDDPSDVAWSEETISNTPFGVVVRP